jgi:ribonuclease HII
VIIAGVDDAGRGCVLGPLVIAAASFGESAIPKLQDLGVRDSKLLSPRKRNALFPEIKKLAEEISIWRINCKKIDSAVSSKERLFKLNYLEARYMALALRRLRLWRVAYIDCCDTNEQRFGRTVQELLLSSNSHAKGRIVKSEHHADENYLVVGAASVLAKVTRDAEVAKLRKENGNFGSGYPSDGQTIDFLRGFFEKSSRPPPFTRLSWETVKRLREEYSIRTLDDYQEIGQTQQNVKAC